MIGSTEKSLEDAIIEGLLTEDLPAKVLFQRLGEKYDVTIYAVYKQLRKLSESGVVLKNKKKYSVSNEWRKAVSDLMGATQEPRLKEGERMVYGFTSFDQLDAYWKHLVRSYHDTFRDQISYNYVPHHLWYYVPGRRESEEALYRSFDENKQYGLYLIGYETTLSKWFRTKYRTEFHKIEIGKLAGMRDTDHIIVVGDLVITTRLSKDLSKKVHNTYMSDREQETAELKIKQLLSTPIKSTFVVERNAKKAEAFKKKFGKYFLLPNTKN